MTTCTLLLIYAVAPLVAGAIERARMRAGLSHKELAVSQGLSQAQWSQQMSGHPGSHLWLDRLTNTPLAFRAALLEELRETWALHTPTLTDVYTLLATIARPKTARAELRHVSEQEEPCG